MCVFKSVLLTLRSINDALAFIGYDRCATIDGMPEVDFVIENPRNRAVGPTVHIFRIGYGSVRQSAFLRLDEQRRHIESLRAAEKEAKIIYDSGWRALFGAKPDLYLYALILLLFAGIYPFEYKGGMDRLLPSVKHGGYTLDRTKFLTAATVSALLFLIFTATDLAFIIRQYPLEMLSAPSLSVIGIPIQTNAPLILYAILFEFRRMLGFVLLSVTVCVASKLLRKPYLIIPAVTVLTLLPHMLIDDLPWWMDFTSLL